MKVYPGISSSNGQSFREIRGAHVFDKVDGSGCWSEWTRKSGWTKHGRREGLLDDSNPHLVVVPSLFEESMAEPLGRLSRDAGWRKVVVYYEFWGARSVAGLHFEGDPKHLTLFDVSVDRQGFLGPDVFRRRFQDVVPTPAFLGVVNWTRGYVARVRNGEVGGVTFEGVVGKAGEGEEVVRAKAKTQRWIDRVIEVHGEATGRKLVES